MKFGVSQALTRKEDDVLLRGAGRYVSDYMPAGTLQGIVLRSPHAHASFRITGIDKARALRGVHLILTAEDTAGLGKLPLMFPIPGVQLVAPPYEILASKEVRHVGDAIAFVVAETIEQAKDAAEAIEVDWQVKPAVIDAVSALKSGASLVWPDRAGNVAFEKSIGDKDKTDKLFKSATKTVSLTIVMLFHSLS
jgi:carbon-monoxide dehydrogenase large subunit